MRQPTTSGRERLSTLGQLDLGDWITIATGEGLWKVQHQIATALSVPNAHVVVPSCNSSGKTWLAARLALAFYDAFKPGVPCVRCGGPCGGSKILTMSSKWEHLKDNLWGEIRRAEPRLRARAGMDGELMPADLRLKHTPGHFIMGQAATAQEGVQGYHAPHVLVIGDEATALSDEMAKGIVGLLASGDARLLAIFNPTDDTTWAYKQATSARSEVIKITAFDTPLFTGEEVPEGADLINPGFLEDLKLAGMGPGTYEWTTRVLAEFWTIGEDKLVASEWFDRALLKPPVYGTRQLGVDLAPYGTSENIIVVRDGWTIREIQAHPAMRVDHFFRVIVAKAVRDVDPDYVVFDADGVGAGALGYAEELQRYMRREAQVIPFRGAIKPSHVYTNNRSAWYWNLRRRFESGQIAVHPHVANDPKLRGQLCDILYSIQNGAIRVETKAEMRKRDKPSPDRADGVMYAFALSEDLPAVTPIPEPHEVSVEGGIDHSDEAMWKRWMELNRDPGGSGQVHPILDVTDW